MHVYLVTYKEAATDTRRALEMADMKEAIDAILFLDPNGAKDVEIFRAEPVTA